MEEELRQAEYLLLFDLHLCCDILAFACYIDHVTILLYGQHRVLA